MNPDDYHLVKIGWQGENNQQVDYILLPKVIEFNKGESQSKCIQCGNKNAMTLHLETNGTGDFCIDCLEDLVDIGITTLKGVA